MFSCTRVSRISDCLIKTGHVSGIKTCRSHTAASAQGRASARGWCGRAPPLAGTGSRPPLGKLGSLECCSRSDRPLRRRRVSLRAGVRMETIKSPRGRQREVFICAVITGGSGHAEPACLHEHRAGKAKKTHYKRKMKAAQQCVCVCVSPHLSAMLSKKSQERDPGPYLTKQT